MTEKAQVILDATMTSSLMSCPRYLDFRFNKNLVPIEGKSNSLEAGSLAHHILEWYYKSIADGKTRNEALDNGFEAGWEYINGYKETNKFLKDKEDSYAQNLPPDSIKVGNTDLVGYNFVIETMRGYFDHYRNDSFTVLGVECVKGKLIYEDDDIAIVWKAKFDLLPDFPTGVVPMDHKTGKQNRTPLSLNNQFIGQCMLTGSRNIIINQIGFQKSMPIHERVRRLTISYTADKIAEWVNDIIPYYARMLVAYNQVDSYPPNFTHCETKYGYCMYKQVCETDRGIRAQTLNVNFRKGKAWDISND